MNHLADVLKYQPALTYFQELEHAQEILSSYVIEDNDEINMIEVSKD